MMADRVLKDLLAAQVLLVNQDLMVRLEHLVREVSLVLLAVRGPQAG